MLRAAILVAALGLAAPGGAADAIRIGEINSYGAHSALALPYANGRQLAIEEINAAGGLLGGRAIAMIVRDDGGKPEEAVKAAEELVANEHVGLLSGTLSHGVALAVSDFALQRKVVFVAGQPLSDELVWSRGHRYAFRLRTALFIHTLLLAEEAAKLPGRRWAVVTTTDEYGQGSAASFKAALAAKLPAAEFVAELAASPGALDAASIVQALAAARPDGIFVGLLGMDLQHFVREGRARGLFKTVAVVSPLAGEPEHLEPLGPEAPEGWIVTGYPWYEVDPADHKSFIDSYRKRFGEDPRLASLVGYITMKAIAVALTKAGEVETEKLTEALIGLTFNTPLGPLTLRDVDHQSTMGAWIGRTAIRDGKPVMMDWRYEDAAPRLPPPEQAAALRPAK